jgi:hypothetical protein
VIPFGDDDEDSEGISALAFGPDGHQLVFASSFPGRVGVWTVGDASDDIQELKPSSERITAVALGSGGNRVAVAGKRATVGAATEVQLLSLDGEEAVGETLPWPHPFAEIYDLWFDAEETRLYGVSSFGGVARWEVSDEQWRKQACLLAGRNLTGAEWERLVGGRAYRVTCSQWPSGD